ncbi:hypothetical protein CJ030_MR2G025524 [Morella rubra]|uniref:Uncharacterized protein n=1 Tax=Morella rubra TaxID=262757 RepID=A0A6A1WFB1_9ROSI|nr:hypothetical protein CJ030_MR2G025524 [Morella rubra]
MTNAGGSSSGATRVPKVPERRDIMGLTSKEQAHMDAILETSSIDWNALVCRENESWLGHTISESSTRENPSRRCERSSHECLLHEDLRKESSHFPYGGTSTKRRYSRETEGSSHRSSSKKSRTSPPMVSEAEEEEAEEASLAHTSSKCGASSWSEDIPHVFSPIFEVRTEISVPVLKEICEIGTPSFNISLAAPSVRGEPFSSPGASSPIATLMPDLPGTLTADCLETDEGDKPVASSSLQHMVLLFDSASSSGSICQKLKAASKCNLATVPLQKQHSMPRTTVVGGSITSALVPADEPITSVADVEGGPVVLPAPSIKGKEQVTCSSSSDDDEEFDSEPSAPLTWRSRSYAQPLLNEEMMEDALQAPRHVKVDRITSSLSHCVSLIAALDAAELKHDEELESSHLKL